MELIRQGSAWWMGERTIRSRAFRSESTRCVGWYVGASSTRMKEVAAWPSAMCTEFTWYGNLTWCCRCYRRRRSRVWCRSICSSGTIGQSFLALPRGLSTSSGYKLNFNAWERVNIAHSWVLSKMTNLAWQLLDLCGSLCNPDLYIRSLQDPYHKPRY